MVICFQDWYAFVLEAHHCCCLAAEDELRKLDSSVKRNTALIKKLRLISEDTKEALLDEIRRANQTKVIPALQ